MKKKWKKISSVQQKTSNLVAMKKDSSLVKYDKTFLGEFSLSFPEKIQPLTMKVIFEIEMVPRDTIIPVDADKCCSEWKKNKLWNIKRKVEIWNSHRR